MILGPSAAPTDRVPQLDRTGVVSGTTNYVGAWSTELEVRAVILGAGEWIPVTAHWMISA